jgi:hypothetical protein
MRASCGMLHAARVFGGAGALAFSVRRRRGGAAARRRGDGAIAAIAPSRHRGQRAIVVNAPSWSPRHRGHRAIAAIAALRVKQ